MLDLILLSTNEHHKTVQLGLPDGDDFLMKFKDLDISQLEESTNTSHKRLLDLVLSTDERCKSFGHFVPQHQIPNVKMPFVIPTPGSSVRETGLSIHVAIGYGPALLLLLEELRMYTSQLVLDTLPAHWAEWMANNVSYVYITTISIRVTYSTVTVTWLQPCNCFSLRNFSFVGTNTVCIVCALDVWIHDHTTTVLLMVTSQSQRQTCQGSIDS